MSTVSGRAGDDVLFKGHRCGTYLALRGILLAADSRPEPWCPQGCEGDTQRCYCPQCVREAARCGTDAGLVEHACAAIR